MQVIAHKNIRLPDCGRKRQRVFFFIATALPISYPTPRDGCVTSATNTAGASVKTVIVRHRTKTYALGYDIITASDVLATKAVRRPGNEASDVHVK